MGASAAPIAVFTVFWAFVGIVLPIAITFTKMQNQGIIRVSLIITSVSCWLFWLCCYLAQMNPLIGPKLDTHTIMIMSKEWGNFPIPG